MNLLRPRLLSAAQPHRNKGQTAHPDRGPALAGLYPGIRDGEGSKRERPGIISPRANRRIESESRANPQPAGLVL